MKRQIIKIDAAACNGCGACVSACHEGAIALIDGKATLMRDDYCDGLGNCLPACPTGAITFEEREAAPYDEAAALAAKGHSSAAESHQAEARPQADPAPLACGCPGTQAKTFRRAPVGARLQAGPSRGEGEGAGQGPRESELRQWPVQIKLVPINAPYFDGADLLVAADCAAFAYASFHEEFIRGRVTLIGCPKLDAVDYTEKLAAIIAQNDIKSLTVVRMEVPCCGGLAQAATEALRASGKFIPWQVVTISTDGRRV